MQPWSFPSESRPTLKKGRVTVPHPKKDLPIKTIASIFKQAEIERRT
ncbi:MAG: type II toxin-antitoxin system HicA family toxin [Tatlockia sp.]|nr:type II toxin-antitoxin system HicA family toxin [Tatlockia sp.]